MPTAVIELKALPKTNDLAQIRYFEPVIDLHQTPPTLHPHVLEATRDIVDERLWKRRPSWRIL
jgi:hypothetical protein